MLWFVADVYDKVGNAIYTLPPILPVCPPLFSYFFPDPDTHIKSIVLFGLALSFTLSQLCMALENQQSVLLF